MVAWATLTQAYGRIKYRPYLEAGCVPGAPRSGTFDRLPRPESRGPAHRSRGARRHAASLNLEEKSMQSFWTRTGVGAVLMLTLGAAPGFSGCQAADKEGGSAGVLAT